ALVILFTSFEIFFFGLILIAASWVMDELAGWTVFVGNVLSATAMLAFYFRRHRGLAHRLAAAWEADDSGWAERATHAGEGGRLRRLWHAHTQRGAARHSSADRRRPWPVRARRRLVRRLGRPLLRRHPAAAVPNAP